MLNLFRIIFILTSLLLSDFTHAVLPTGAWSQRISLKAKKVTSNNYFNCALLENSQIKCWGQNSEGQLGQGHANNMGDGAREMGEALSIVDLGTNRFAIDVQAGLNFACALLDNSTLKCWGTNGYGQLGQGHGNSIGDEAGEMGDSLPAINLGSNRTVIQMAVGYYHVCVILDDGSVKCWGQSIGLGLGQASNDVGNDAGEMGDALPALDLGTGRKAIKLFNSTTGGNTCALLDNGTNKCWGSNYYGQLGQGSIGLVFQGDAPNEMGDNLPVLDLGTNLSARGFSFGYGHMCAILSDSTLKCWGTNSSGQLGQGHTDSIGDGAGEMGDSLVRTDLGTGRTALQVVSTGSSSCVLLDNGKVKCWGLNSRGQLGYGNTTALGSSAAHMGDNLPYLDLGTNRYALQLSAGFEHVCALLDDGSVKCWGGNGNGQLGRGNTTRYGDGANEMGNNLLTANLGFRINRLVSVKQIASGGSHACALRDNSQVKCWGYNNGGQLGLGDTQNRGDGANEMGDILREVSLGTGLSAVQIVAGSGHSCARLDNSQVKCWGSNSYGQLGLGDTQNRGDGANELGDNLPFINLGTGRSALHIVAGEYHTCALLDNSQMKCWGFNNNGQLGLGDVANRGDGASEMGDNLPFVDLGTNRRAIQISAGYNHTCVLLDNSQVKCWGKNLGGQLGLGNTANRGNAVNQMGDNLPVLSFGTGRFVVQIVSGSDHNCVLLDNSQMKCWGFNGSGQLGIGDNQTRGDGAGEMGDSLPSASLGTGRIPIQILNGANYSCAILDNSQMKCWGLNNYGQLGLGDTSNYGNSSGTIGDSLPYVSLGSGRSAVQITAGNYFTCVLMDNSRSKCWGYNFAGQLGKGETAIRGDGANEMGDFLPVINLGTGK